MQVYIIIRGEVQGVFFRDFVKQAADRLGITGWVRNSENGTVEVVAQGKKQALLGLIEQCRKGPPLVRVTSLDTVWQNPSALFQNFTVA